MSAAATIHELADRLRRLLCEMLRVLEAAVADGGDSNVETLHRKVLRFTGELAIFLPN